MIADFIARGKSLGPKLLVPAIIVLVALASFGLGRLSALEGEESEFTIWPAGSSPEEERPDYAL